MPRKAKIGYAKRFAKRKEETHDEKAFPLISRHGARGSADLNLGNNALPRADNAYKGNEDDQKRADRANDDLQRR